MSRDDRTKHEVSPRMQVGVVVGFIAMVLGFLFALSQASEAEAWPMQVSAAVVLLHMVGGYVIGWLAQPLLSRIFTGS
jgi:hypothetical protein